MRTFLGNALAAAFIALLPACGRPFSEPSGLKLGETTLEEHFPSKTTRDLIISACAGNKAVLDTAIADGASISDPGRDNVPPMHWMVANDCPLGVRTLLDKGVPVDVKMPAGETPLWGAARFASPKIVMMLLEAGANPNAVARDSSVLVNAVSGERLDNVQLLVKHGADVNWRRAGSFFTAATLADAQGNYAIVLFLLENGYNVDLSTFLVGIEDSPRAGADAAQEEYRKQVVEFLRKKLPRAAQQGAPAEALALRARVPSFASLTRLG